MACIAGTAHGHACGARVCSPRNAQHQFHPWRIDQLLDGVRAERPGLTCTHRELFSVVPTLTEKSAPVVQAVAAAVEEQFGRPPEYVVSPGTYDQKHIDRIGRLRNCIAYGPGVLDLAHQPDEWVGMDDMVDAAQVMARSLLTLLAPEV